MWFIVPGSFIPMIPTNWLCPVGANCYPQAVSHFQVAVAPKLHFHSVKLILVKEWITNSLFFLQILKLSVFSRKLLEKTVAHSLDLCDILNSCLHPGHFYHSFARE